MATGAIGSGYDWLSDPRSAPYLHDLTIGAQNSAIAAERSGHPENALTVQELANQIGGESSFDPDAINPKAVNGEHATGIAGILPSTAAQPGYGLSSVDLTDPHAAIQFAGAYDGAVGIKEYSGGGYSKADLSSNNGSAVSAVDAANADAARAYALKNPDATSIVVKDGKVTGASIETGLLSNSSGMQQGLQGIVAAGGEIFTRVVVAGVGLLLIGGGLLMFRPVQNAVQNGASIAKKVIK